MSKTAAGLKLIGLAERLRAIESARVNGLMKPVPAGREREKALCDAVVTLAKYFDVILKPITSIDANGELAIVSQGEKATDLVGKPFSRDFCDVLNTCTKPRCGAPGFVAVMNPEHANWCRINHLEAEKMVFAVDRAIV